MFPSSCCWLPYQPSISKCKRETNLISADEFIGESQARHETPLLQPEDGSEGAREEDSLNGSKGHNSLSWNTSVKIRDEPVKPDVICIIQESVVVVG